MCGFFATFLAVAQMSTPAPPLPLQKYDPKVPMLWIPDSVHVWKLAQLLHISHDGSDELRIRDLVTNETSTISSHLTHPLDPTHLSDLNDLCGMNNLHEAPLLSILRQRFDQDKIYTNTGNVLISINPYKSIPHLYEHPLQYLSAAQASNAGDTPARVTLPPHVYHVANAAFNCVVEGKSNQSVIVSGESGAGKTEASKYVMQFLITANEKMASSSIGEDIKQVLLDSNAIFESFGNSKTVRNDNSSRFGKYIKLQYNSDDCLISAFTETFLLEKSRLSFVGLGERNYHIFYQMIRGIGASSDFADKAALYLERVEDFSILTGGECTVLNSEFEDITEFNHLHGALATMGTTPSEMHHIWEILSIILHLGNMQCSDKPQDEMSSAESEHHHNVQLHSPIMPFDALSQLLGVDPNLFADRLIHHHVRITRGRRMSAVVKSLSVNDVKNNILGLNKWLYSSLFNWLVKKINHAHLSVASRPHHAKVPSGRRHSRAAEMEMQTLANHTATKFIGILDIFGFEILGKNSFEQLWYVPSSSSSSSSLSFSLIQPQHQLCQ
jgi:myosin V